MRLRADFKQQRQEEALERLELTQAESPEVRLNALDSRLGVGIGAVKERARLQAKLKASRKADFHEMVEKAGPLPTSGLATSGKRNKKSK